MLWYIDEMATDGCVLHGPMHAAYTWPRPNGCVWPLGLTFAKGECESVRHGLRGQTAGGLSVPGRDASVIVSLRGVVCAPLIAGIRYIHKRFPTNISLHAGFC